MFCLEVLLIYRNICSPSFGFVFAFSISIEEFITVIFEGKHLNFTLTVMGSGVADARTIKGDVTFPNYRWTELADVKKKWNASTFLVLPQQMIKDLNEGV